VSRVDLNPTTQPNPTQPSPTNALPNAHAHGHGHGHGHATLLRYYATLRYGMLCYASGQRGRMAGIKLSGDVNVSGDSC